MDLLVNMLGMLRIFYSFLLLIFFSFSWCHGWISKPQMPLVVRYDQPWLPDVIARLPLQKPNSDALPSHQSCALGALVDNIYHFSSVAGAAN